MEMYEGMMKMMTNAEISIGLMRSRYNTYPPQQFDLTVGEEDTEGELDVLGSPIVLGSHVVASGPRTLEERSELEPKLTWDDVQESINSMATTCVDSLVGEELDIVPR